MGRDITASNTKRKGEISMGRDIVIQKKKRGKFDGERYYNNTKKKRRK